MSKIFSPEEVERLAADAGLSITEFCELADIAHTTFYRWRAGKAPRLPTYQKIVDAIAKLPRRRQNRVA
jgi:predicted transcriptional regulator